MVGWPAENHQGGEFEAPREGIDIVRGRKPTPLKLRIIRGNPGKRALGKEPQFETEAPAKPPLLTGAAAEEWDRLTEQLSHAGLLRTVDRAALAMYCQAWARWVNAEQKVETFGVVISAKGREIKNIYLRVAEEAMAQLIRLAAEFGMTPASRTRLTMGPEGGRKDPLDLFNQRRQAAKTQRPVGRSQRDREPTT